MDIIHEILKEAIKMKASDIHLSKNVCPILRIDGELIQLNNYEIMNKEELNRQLHYLLDEKSIEKYEENKYIDFSYEYSNSRFRMHIFKESNCDAYALRLIPLNVPLLNEINIPMVLRQLCFKKNGLVLVTGTTGSGKTTTLASLINEINESQKKHIITVEDPIEFLHVNKKCIINQREVGQDVVSFSDAVRSAMREDPDILLLGEMRDLDTIMNAITMAETGHLVFATLHTKSVAETVDRIIDVFPSTQQKQIRLQVANTLQAIISQELLVCSKGGRVPVCEILLMTDAVRSIIKENNPPNAIIDQMQMNYKKIGCQTHCQALADLYKKSLITKEVAFENTNDKEMLQALINN